MTEKRDLVLLLDMLQAAQDARVFVAGMSRDEFYSSRLHQNTTDTVVEAA